MSLLIGTESGLRDLSGAELLGGSINHVARDGDTWWAADATGAVFREGQPVLTMPADTPAWCLQPAPNDIWIGSSEARLFAFDGTSLELDEFFATAPGRETWYTPWGGPADVRSMTLDADHTLYINVHVGGILRYDDTGVAPTLDVDADVHQVQAHATLQGAVFAATAYGLAFTHNGHDFSFRTDGLHAHYCRAVAVLEDHVFVSASTGPSSTRGRLYRGPLWEDDLEPMTTGLPEWFPGNLDTHCLVALDGKLYAGHGNTVWVSDDHGSTWETAVTDLPTITALA